MGSVNDEIERMAFNDHNEPAKLHVTLNDEDLERVNEIKEQYFMLAGDQATPKGMAVHIWRLLLDLQVHVKVLTSENEKAWDEKRRAVSVASIALLNKYEGQLKSKDGEIECLKKLLLKASCDQAGTSLDTKISINRKSDTGCPGCGSETTC